MTLAQQLVSAAMHRHGTRFGCGLLLSTTLLTAQELVSRDGPLTLRGVTAFDIHRNRLVVLGDLRDIHESDGQRWFRRPMRTTGWLGGRLEYHAATRRTIGFGTDTGFVPSTVEWDGAVWRQLSPATTPPARANAAMAYDAARARVVMFGGTNQTLLDDTWEWDGSNWFLCPAAVAPSPRSDSAMAFDSARGLTVLFGGAVFQAYDAQTWEWNGANWQQRVLPASPPALGPRDGLRRSARSHRDVRRWERPVGIRRDCLDPGADGDALARRADLSLDARRARGRCRPDRRVHDE
jgi:hypothetical protein